MSSTVVMITMSSLLPCPRCGEPPRGCCRCGAIGAREGPTYAARHPQRPGPYAYGRTPQPIWRLAMVDKHLKPARWVNLLSLLHWYNHPSAALCDGPPPALVGLGH